MSLTASRVHAPSWGTPSRLSMVGHLDQRPSGKLVPHTADDGGLLGHDHQLARSGETAGAVAQAAVAERVVAPMPAVLE